MIITTGTKEGIENTLIDENGNEIDSVWSWDTEEKIAQRYDSKGKLYEESLPNAKLVPVSSVRK